MARPRTADGDEKSAEKGMTENRIKKGQCYQVGIGLDDAHVRIGIQGRGGGGGVKCGRALDR